MRVYARHRSFAHRPAWPGPEITRFLRDPALREASSHRRRQLSPIGSAKILREAQPGHPGHRPPIEFEANHSRRSRIGSWPISTTRDTCWAKPRPGFGLPSERLESCGTRMACPSMRLIWSTRLNDPTAGARDCHATSPCRRSSWARKPHCRGSSSAEDQTRMLRMIRRRYSRIRDHRKS